MCTALLLLLTWHVYSLVTMVTICTGEGRHKPIANRWWCAIPGGEKEGALSSSRMGMCERGGSKKGGLCREGGAAWCVAVAVKGCDVGLPW